MMFGNNIESKHIVDRIKENSIGVELGVWKGISSEKFAKKTKHLHLVDAWAPESYQVSKEHGTFEDYLERYSKLVGSKNPKDFIFCSKNVYKFNDIPMLHRIKNSMVGDREVRIMLEISDSNGNMLYQTCYVPDSVNGRKSSFYNIGETRSLMIYGNEFETGVLKATIDQEHNYVVQRANKIEVSVVADIKCRW